MVIASEIIWTILEEIFPSRMDILELNVGITKEKQSKIEKKEEREKKKKFFFHLIGFSS